MNFERNSQMNQIPQQPQSPSPTPPPPPHFLNQFPFPATDDVDWQLRYNLSSLSLNPNTGGRAFLPSSLDGYVTSPISGEGFISPLTTANYNNRVYSDVGPSASVTVDPRLHHHYQYRYQYPPSMFDFDQWSYLLAKEQQFYRILNNNHAREPKSRICQHLSVMSLKELKGMIYYLAKDQNGFRILQSKFENPTEEEVEIVMFEVMGSIADLMKDQFGNHIIQKLISVCNDYQLSLIVRELTENAIDIIIVSMTPYGTRSVQKLLENLKSLNETMMVMRALQCGVAELATDPNGHHVIKYCLLNFKTDLNQLILNEIAENCYKLATDRNGCCVLQACIERPHGQIRNRIISELINNAIHIAEDPFGNYVLQHLAELKSPEITEHLVRHLRGNFVNLSQDKYASNVVEKCLINSGPNIVTKIILELVGSANPASLLVHPYGNFVIQSALKVSKGFAYECLRKLISSNVSSMQSNLYGKKILEKIEKRRITQI